MTFEEIHDKILSGERAGSVEEIEQSLELLVRYGGKTEVMIAVRIAEARIMRPGGDFWRWIAEKYPFPGEKTAHHRYAVGRMLLDLRDYEGESEIEKENRAAESQARKTFTKCLSLSIGKLEDMTVIHHKRGTAEVINFLKLHVPREEERLKKSDLTREEMLSLRNLTYGFGKKTAADAGQLAFEFDTFSPLQESQLADLMESDKFTTPDAMRIAANGALLCRNANRYLAAHAEEFSENDVDGLESLAAELEEAKKHILAIVNSKKRKVLALDK